MPETLIDPEDGLPADKVHQWTKKKHQYLERYVDISRAARGKYLGPGKSGATFIDLFCGVGRARIVETREWIDGSAVVAWKTSVRGSAPFSEVYVSDIDDERRTTCAERLKKLGAPVRELPGNAVDAAQAFARSVNPYGLHCAFIDPYSLGALDFGIIQALSQLRRIDMMIHVSAMDLQRNLDANIGGDDEAFDRFAPGWRERVDLRQAQEATRASVVDHWRTLVSANNVQASTRMELITGSRN